MKKTVQYEDTKKSGGLAKKGKKFSKKYANKKA
jgi:hypothetical protein